MSPPTWKNEVNIQTMIAILGLISALAGGLVAGSLVYSSLVAEAGRQSDRLQVLEQSFRERVILIDSRNALIELRIRAMEVAQASQSSDLRNIQAGIDDIKSSISDMVRKP